MVNKTPNITALASTTRLPRFPGKNLAVYLPLALAATFPGCKKDSRQSEAIITIHDGNSQAIANASVRFFVDSEYITRGTFDSTLTTDASGVATLAMKHECVLDVFVKFTEGSQTRVGETTVWMKEGESTTDTIVIR